MVMLKDIAKMAGVSQASVSLVRKGRHGVSDAVREQIQALLHEYGYSYAQYDAQTGLPADQAARNAATSTIRLLTYKKHAMLVDGNDGFVTAIIAALDLEARQLGYQLLVSVLGPQDSESLIQSAMQTPVDGVLVIATEMSEAELVLLDGIKVPLVILDSDFISSSYSCVTMNNRELAFAAVQHLLVLGHRCVGYLRSSVPTGNFQSRTDGYRQALHQARLPLDDQFTYYLRPTLNAAYLVMLAQLLEARTLPTAFFADNDILAIGAMKALNELGYKVPRDISIIGVDNIPFGSVSAPPLTTMGISCDDIGRWAVRLLVQAIKMPDAPKTKIQVSAALVKRNSTAIPKFHHKPE